MAERDAGALRRRQEYRSIKWGSLRSEGSARFLMSFVDTVIGSYRNGAGSIDFMEMSTEQPGRELAHFGTTNGGDLRRRDPGALQRE
jgi:hypothetical protein